MEAKCPSCQAPLKYDIRFFGRKFKCATCLRVIAIDKHGALRLVVPKTPGAPAVKPAPVTSPPITYMCQHCKGTLETDAWMGMQDEECPFCGKVNRVPPSKEQRRQQEGR